MADQSGNTSSSNTCKPTIDEKLFDLACLGPALAIILTLAFLKRRKNLKLEYCHGYPGLLIPVDFLGRFSLHNRFTIAATFGATAGTCLGLFLTSFFQLDTGSFITSSDPSWAKVFQDLVFVLVYGILFYPFFTCLTTDYRLIGSVLGFFYAAIRFSFRIVIDFQVLSCLQETSFYAALGIATYLCLLFIFIRFAVLIFLEVRKKWFQSASDNDTIAQASQTRLVGQSGREYVKLLLNPGLNVSTTEDKWLMKLIYFIYKPRTDFKFSTQFVSTLVVAAISIFEVFVSLIVVIDYLKKTLLQSCTSDFCRPFNDALIVLFDSLLAGFIVSGLISALMLLHFIRCHRDHVLQLYRGQRTFHQDVFVSPVMLVGRSLRFSGFQIAYAIAGFIVLGISLSGVFFILGVIFKYEFLSRLVLRFGIALLPTVGMAVFVWLFQLFLAHFVFRNRDFPKITITVDNRRLFSIMSFFFFFYNILLGLFSCFKRIIVGMLLGVLFLARIDRTSWMRGFQRWDRAFVAYLGFVNLLVAHSHPVMLMFCQLLINRDKHRGLEETLPPNQSVKQGSPEENGNATVYTRHLRLPRLSQKAVNRWHIAVTLLRNPSLIKYRKQGGVTSAVNLGSIYADLSALVKDGVSSWPEI